MNTDLSPYLITAYTDRHVIDVEAQCRDDEHAIDKARRYGSLRHFSGDLPAAIFSHVVALQAGGTRVVGTWEYRLKGLRKPAFWWHPGIWDARPNPDDKVAIRSWKLDG